ncbi:translocation/assembly module TamB domain-containing protein [Sphingobacterium sp. UT-1RO-CII-1]|nr:translocation/assembly module TamB domain-containing protein [Sphingobacterium sp. UT-1RO-CII-1]MCY4779748.1 translocation/assembly module TamB domain-containing protein [Sphingobacterium sp. UT-1RO-CII-1]
MSILDRKGQQMLSIPQASAQISIAQILNSKLSIRKVALNDAFLHYEMYKDSSNFTFLINYFAPNKKNTKSNSKKISIELNDIELINNQIKFTNHQYKPKKQGLDISNLDLSFISVKIKDIQQNQSSYSAKVENLKLKEQSGFILQNLTSTITLSKTQLELANLTLQTNRSRLTDYISLNYIDIKDFENFMESVHVKSNLKNSLIDSRDIEFFAPNMKYVRFISEIKKASLNGTVEHIQVEDANLNMLNSTQLKGSFTIKGLPNIDQTKFDFNIESLTTSANELEQIVPGLANTEAFILPEALKQFGTIQYRGILSGYYHHFKTLGKIQTDLGNLNIDTDFNLKPSFQYVGHLTSDSFSLGSLLNSPLLASSSLDINFDGKGLAINDIKLTANGKLNNLDFNKYTYEQVDFDTEIDERIFYANVAVNDPSARLHIDSKISWKDNAPIHSFSSHIDLLDLKTSNLLNKDSITLTNSIVHAQLTGSALNSITGEIVSDQIHFNTSHGNFTIRDFNITSKEENKTKILSIQSDAVDAKMSGQIDLPTLANYFQSLAMRYAPAINIEAKNYNPQNFNLNVLIKKYKPLSTFLHSDLEIHDNTKLNAHFSSDHYKANFEAHSPSVKYKGLQLTNLKLIENADEKAFSLNITADRLSLTDSTYIEGIKLTNVLANDSLHFGMLLSEEHNANYLNLHGNIHFAPNKPAYIKFSNSKIILNNEQWSIDETADLRVSKGKFYLNNLLFKRQQQEVALNGILSDQDDDINIMFKEFNLSALAGITMPMGIELHGQMNGDITINSVFKTPRLSAHITTSPIVYNNLPIGSLYIDADYEPSTALIKLNTKLSDINQNGINLTGSYNLNTKTDALQLNGNIKNMDIAVAQPFLRSLVSGLYGKVSGDLAIRGSIYQPIINGRATVHEAGFLVKYLQTHYTLTQQNLLLDNNSFILTDVKIRDHKNIEASANGSINLNTLSDPTLNVNLRTDNFQILNTNKKNNELFYGTAYASGNFTFSGQTSAINIDINAQSNPNTTITIPFNSSLTISDNDFIYFSNPNSAEDKTKTSLFKGLTMNMDIEITRETEINLENNVGSLKSLGTGNISLKISSLGDFEMFGDYHVLSGKFHFTAQDFFNKYFDLKEGGTIRWAGIPSEATINLGATYEQRTSVAPLYNAAGHAENSARTLAQATMLLRGPLNQPEISFDLNFPQDPYIKDELQGYLSDGNSLNQQAISLIVRRSFTPASTQEFGKEVNNTLLSAGTEIAFNQLNTIISQSLNMNFLDLNIRSFNDASASLRFFDDRLILTGGVSDRRNTIMNDLNLFSDQIATDAELTFRLRQDGNLVLRAYNRLNTKSVLFNPYSDYISAVGIVYRQEFNSIAEFWRKMWIWKEKKETKKITSPDTSKNFIHFK